MSLEEKPSLPLADVRNARLQKVAALRAMGIDPYPATCRRTHLAGELVAGFDAMAGTHVVVGGRLLSRRKQGALAFGHVQDQSGRIQLYLRRDTVRPGDADAGTLGYDHLNLIDVGDFVEAAGTLTRTERGEISVLVETLRMLTKSLRPLPDKWAGLRDREAVLRRRYLDTTLHPERRLPFDTIARMLSAIRGFLDERGFLEFHTPVIQPQYGGGTARPFLTHVNALRCDMYLAISHELYLKRLIVAGYDRVYTIGRYFRNEGIDRTHQPEFSMIETMVAYENYEFNMDLIEALFGHVARHVFGKTEFQVRGHAVDFGRPWERVSMADAVARETGIDFRALDSVEIANARLAEIGIREPQPTVGESLAKAFEEIAGPKQLQPTLVYGHPVEISPLAKPMPGDPRFAERFEIYVAGTECGDNWSEQNDPVQLLAFWRQAYEAAGGDTAELHPLDYDFIEALEYGMPPTTGIGPGIERMAMIFTEQENIDDVVFFPMLRPLLSPVNRAIYGVQEHERAPAGSGDLLLTFDEFAAMLADGTLAPGGPQVGSPAEILVRPHLHVWSGPGGSSRGAGSVEIEGLIEHRRLQLVGYSVVVEGGFDQKRGVKQFAEFARRQVVGPLQEGVPGQALVVTEVAFETAG